MNLRPHGLPMLIAATALTLVFGCEARVDRGTDWNYQPTIHLDLAVHVLDNTGRPMPGATVRLYRKVDEGTIFLTHELTDGNGGAIFPEPDFGQYLVTGSKQGYVTNSTFAIVADGSVTAGELRLSPIANLPDVVQATVPQTGGTVTTQPVPNLSASSVTFGAGALTGSAQVTLGTLVGQQIPPTPPAQVALSAVLVDVTAGLSGSATINLGLPFDLPEGTKVPIFAFDETTNQWKQVATGTVQGGVVVASIDDIGTISALASFVPRRTQMTPDITVSSRPLGPDDGPVVEIRWIPRLTFPEGTNYSDKAKTWIRGVIEQIRGLKFDELVVTKVTRDPNAVQMLYIFQHQDLYTIEVYFGGTKPTRGVQDTTTMSGISNETTTETSNVWHKSGFGSGG